MCSIYLIWSINLLQYRKNGHERMVSRQRHRKRSGARSSLSSDTNAPPRREFYCWLLLERFRSILSAPPSNLQPTFAQNAPSAQFNPSNWSAGRRAMIERSFTDQSPQSQFKNSRASVTNANRLFNAGRRSNDRLQDETEATELPPRSPTNS